LAAHSLGRLANRYLLQVVIRRLDLSIHESVKRSLNLHKSQILPKFGVSRRSSDAKRRPFYRRSGGRRLGGK
jgi:hypothetical protein